MGSYRIERTFPSPVGKIVRATGTKDERIFRRILEAIDYVGNRLGSGPLWVSILLRVKDGSYSPKEMMAEYEDTKFVNLDWSVSNNNLLDEMNAWIDSPSDYKPKTIKDYRQQFRLFLRDHQESVVSELPDLLRTYKGRCKREATYRKFSVIRAVCMAFVRDAVKDGEASKLWKDVEQVRVFQAPLTRAKNEHKPFPTPAVLVQLFSTAEPWLKKYEDLVWFLCLHGFRKKEFLEDPWFTVPKDSPRPTHLWIAGEKNEDSKRELPLIFQPPPIKPSYPTLRKIFKALGGRTCHDSRRTYQVWIPAAGVDPDRVDKYLGHSQAKHQRQNYKKPDDMIRDWILPDTEKIREWLKKAKRD